MYRQVQIILTIVSIVLLVINSHAAAQGMEQKSLSLDRNVKGNIIEWLCSKMNEIYVFQDTAKGMAELISQKYKSNQYDTINNIIGFTRQLTTDLRSVYPDQHLKISYDPGIEDTINPAIETRTATRLKEQWRMNNYGFMKLEHLACNIGYLKMDGFANTSWARDEAVGVMQFLSNCNAVIIDLQDNRGGYGNMNKLILSYFFRDATLIGSRYIRSENILEQAWTTDDVDGRKMTDVDLYVLTSSRTFSAAEAFAFSLKNRNRATIVGEKTAGGGNTVESVANTKYKILARIPNGRAIGKSFEGTGVEPDVNVPREEALKIAYILALENLSKKSDGKMKSLLSWTAEYQRAMYKPFNAQPGLLKKLEGNYRSMKIQYENGCLYVIWPNEKNRVLLHAVSESTFIVDGDSDIRLNFKISDSGQVVTVNLVYSDGYQDEIPRTTK